MQRLEVSGAVRPIYGSLGVKRLMCDRRQRQRDTLVGYVKVQRDKQQATNRSSRRIEENNKWVRALPGPMHLGLKTGPILNYGSPVP